MASGLEMFDALAARARELPAGRGELRVNVIDKLDLMKLKPSDLLARGFSESAAEKNLGRPA